MVTRSWVALLLVGGCVQTPKSAGETLTGGATSNDSEVSAGSMSASDSSGSASMTSQGPDGTSSGTSGDAGTTEIGGSESTMGIVSESATMGSTTDDPTAESSTSTTGPPPPECYDVDPVPEGLVPDGECDPYDQDCAVGEKCTYLDSDADGYYDETVCVPLDGDPAQAGDVCSFDEDALDGVDDCDLALICYYGLDSGSGVCVEFPGGSVDNPVCNNPADDVTLVHDEVLLCLPTCSPLLADCPDGSACMLSYGIYVCMDNSLAAGGAGAACDNSSDCDDGYSCQEGTCRQHCDASGGEPCDCVPMCDPYPGAEDFGLCY